MEITIRGLSCSISQAICPNCRLSISCSFHSLMSAWSKAFTLVSLLQRKRTDIYTGAFHKSPPPSLPPHPHIIINNPGAEKLLFAISYNISADVLSRRSRRPVCLFTGRRPRLYVCDSNEELLRSQARRTEEDYKRLVCWRRCSRRRRRSPRAPGSGTRRLPFRADAVWKGRFRGCYMKHVSGGSEAVISPGQQLRGRLLEQTETFEWDVFPKERVTDSVWMEKPWKLYQMLDWWTGETGEFQDDIPL